MRLADGGAAGATPPSRHRQNGQQQPPVAANFVAAAALVPKSPMTIAINPRILALIAASFRKT
jgi:hypothetical protein